MNKKKKPLFKTEKHRDLDNGALIILFGTFAILIFPYLLTRSSFFPSFTDKTGVVGDTIGGITAPIVGLVGAILVYYALKEQVKANDLIIKQFNEQKKITYRQNFEQVFFNMLNLHRDNVNSFSLTPSEINWELHFDDNEIEKISLNEFDNLRLTKHKLDNIFNPYEEEKLYKNRSFFKHSIERLIDLIYLSDKYGGINKKIEKTKFEATSKSESFYSYFPHIYNGLFHTLNEHLGHYYRNLYRIIKMIDDQKFSEDEKEDYEAKYLYASIVRSQLSDHEIQWLFFNGLYDYGKLFKPLIEEYSLLKNLRNNNDETIIKFKPYYKETAFEEVKWIDNIDPLTGLNDPKRKNGYERTCYSQHFENSN